MIQGNVATESRWVLRTLWVIVGLVAIGLLSIRSNSVLTQSQALLDGFKRTAALAFTVPTDGQTVPASLDVMDWPGHEPVRIHPGVVATVVAGTPLTISGWAFDTGANAIFAGVGARIDSDVNTDYGIINLPRDDVATALRNARARNSGFSSTIDTQNLAPGAHTIRLRALAPDQKTAVALGTVTFVIGSRALAEQKTDSIDAVNGIIIDKAATETSPIAIGRSTKRLTIVGWGFITNGRHLAGNVSILLDGNPAVTARYGMPRSDVARAYRDVRVSRSGFEGVLPLDAVRSGEHEIRLRLGDGDGTSVDSKSVLRVVIRNYL